MILTGREIEHEWMHGRITIEPFTPEQVNPNSYNFRLGRRLRTYADEVLDPRRQNTFVDIEIPDEGYLLEPGRLYLAHTEERLGSDHYAPTFAARSSVARLGLFINLSASLGDIGYAGQWTLQLFTMNRVRVYPGISIGQMMWWRPQGEIITYDGKYQGSVGPRTSDIHRDLDRQLARTRLPGLRTAVRPGEVGPKFAALAAHSRVHRVPPAFVVPAAELVAALSAEHHEELRRLFAELQATVGAFYTETSRRLLEVAGTVRVPQDLREALACRVRDVFGGDDRELAVRSSGLDEDTAGGSLAGVYASVLGVRGIDALVEAVERCWLSYFEAPAVAARIRAHDFRPEPRLAVIVQQMVRPRLAGVAFTGPGAAPHDIRIDYIEGLADQLVAGTAAARRWDPSTADGGPDTAVLGQVAALARALRDERGHDVDVEWAADGQGVHLVQVRPVTGASRADRETGLLVRAHPLYSGELPGGFPLGEVASVYRGYVAKRAPAYRLLADVGAEMSAGWVVRFNGAGLAGAEGDELDRILAAAGHPECVLDLGDNLRQIVVPTGEVRRRLLDASGATARSAEGHTAIVRGFVRGDWGLISRRSERGLVVEYTDEGLLALNRGTAGARCIVMEDVAAGPGPDNVTAPEDAAAVVAHLETLARATDRMHDRYGPVTLEWVLAGGRLYFVDFSTTGGSPVRVTAGQVEISPGTAHGPLLRLDDDEVLSRLSIGPAVSVDRSRDVTTHADIVRLYRRVQAMPHRPIVSVARPYAVLSILIGHVAGFVFDEGSALCHLAIMLREAGVPAVAASGVAGRGDATISDGTISVTGGGKAGDDGVR